METTSTLILLVVSKEEYMIGLIIIKERKNLSN